ncbi:MAG: histidine triad nucleotide-binding protein [Candidatus Berkiellales bacterium]
MEDCLFCQMAEGKIPTNKIYEDEHIFVIHDIHPKAKVHLLVISKLHIPSLTEVQEEHAPLLGYMMTSLKNFAKEQGLSSFRTVVNTGKNSGQVIFHLHFHILGGSPLSSM